MIICYYMNKMRIKMKKQGIKVMCNALWSIAQMPGTNFNETVTKVQPQSLTGDIKFDLSIQRGNAHERKE
jgi:hypothetical protein